MTSVSPRAKREGGGEIWIYTYNQQPCLKGYTYQWGYGNGGFGGTYT